MFAEEVINVWVITKSIILNELNRKVTEEDIKGFIDSLWERKSFREDFIREYGREYGIDKNMEEEKIKELFKATVAKIVKKYEESAKEVGF